MALKIRCSSCKKYFGIKSRASTRPALSAKIGEYSRHQCKHCLAEAEYHVNDISAESTPIVIFGALVIGLLVIFIASLFGGLVFGLFVGGGIITAGMISGSAPSGFNGYRMSRTREEAALREAGIKRSHKFKKKPKSAKPSPKDFKFPGSPF